MTSKDDWELAPIPDGAFYIEIPDDASELCDQGGEAGSSR